jgi:hypothetical protein
VRAELEAFVAAAALCACGGAVAEPPPALGAHDDSYDGVSDARPPSTDSGRVGATVIQFASGTDWPSFNGDLDGPVGASVGHARAVCVSPGVPANCAADAVVFRTSGVGWTATVDAPNAAWIWRGDVTPTGQADLQFAVFQKTFTLGANPTGSIQVAADDLVSVRVNGVLVGSAGSLTDPNVAYQAQLTATTLDLGSFLAEGANTLTIVAQNGPASFAGCGTPCTFQQNLAGVLFGGSLSSD